MYVIQNRENTQLNVRWSHFAAVVSLKGNWRIFLLMLFILLLIFVRYGRISVRAILWEISASRARPVMHRCNVIAFSISPEGTGRFYALAAIRRIRGRARIIRRSSPDMTSSDLRVRTNCVYITARCTRNRVLVAILCAIATLKVAASQ